MTPRQGFTATQGVSVTVPAHDHDWSAWEVAVQPACTEEGIETRACMVYGEKEDRPLAASGHGYTAAPVPPTCTEEGYAAYSCTRCGHSYADDYVAAPGHDWGPWTVTTPASTQREGTETRVCALDGNHAETHAITKLTAPQKWWETLPGWVQMLLRIFLFGWIWM